MVLKSCVRWYQDNVDEFRSDEAHLLSWHRLAASLPLCAFLSLGPLPNSNVFAKPGNCSALQHFALVPDAGSSLFQIKSVSGGGGGGVEDGGAGLEEVWEPLQNQLQDQLQDQFQDQLPEHAAAGLAVHLQVAPALPTLATYAILSAYLMHLRYLLFAYAV